MRAGRSILGECIAVVRYRRVVATLRHVALLVLGIGLCLGAAYRTLVGDFDGPLFCVMFVVMLWGATLCAIATWRLL